MNKPNELAVCCRDLNLTFYQGGAAIKGLDHVSLEIHSGDSICLSGPPGSGKTTLLNVMGGLLSPDSGQVLIGEQNLSDMKASELANLRLRDIGFVFQSYNLVPVLSALENVGFIMEMQGRPKPEIESKAKAMLDRVGLSGLYDRRPAQLSGGQQQRVAVARAIVSEPTLVLADEPTANLDSQTALQLMELFQSLNKDFGTTFVIATHDTRIEAYTNRHIRMQDGRIESDRRD